MLNDPQRNIKLLCKCFSVSNSIVPVTIDHVNVFISTVNWQTNHVNVCMLILQLH